MSCYCWLFPLISCFHFFFLCKEPGSLIASSSCLHVHACQWLQLSRSPLQVLVSKIDAFSNHWRYLPVLYGRLSRMSPAVMRAVYFDLTEDETDTTGCSPDVHGSAHEVVHQESFLRSAPTCGTWTRIHNKIASRCGAPRPPMTDVGTETAFRLDQRKHFRKSKHLLRSEVVDAIFTCVDLHDIESWHCTGE